MTPYFDSISDFMHMGGHGFYVWLCFFLVIGSVLVGVGYIKSERKRAIKQLKINYILKQNRKRRISHE